MKGDVHGTSQLDERASALDVDATIAKQNAERDTTGAGAFCLSHLSAHQLKFLGGIDKVAAPGTDQHMNGNGEGAEIDGRQLGSRRDSATMEFRAEFDAVCSACHCGGGRIHRFNAQLKEDRIHDGSRFSSVGRLLRWRKCESSEGHRSAEP